MGTVAFDAVVMAASIGGLQAFSHILADLPADFPLPVVLAQHIAPERPSLLAELLSRRTWLRVKQAEDGEALRPATVYTPVPNRHSRVRAGGALALDRGAEGVFRATDGGRAVRVGDRLRGTGVLAVRDRGGFVIAQGEATPEEFSMP